LEHRNSTVITEPGAPSARGVTLRTPQGREAALDAISHEFFHSWNVERIRPAGLEPFDFTRANITCCLWLAEGFTQYYGRLQLFRAGLLQRPPVNAPAAVINGSGRMVRSAVEMSEWAAFADAARSVDPTDQSRSFISYYTYGSAIALALDLSIREVSSGRLSLDDYMKLLWKLHGKPGGPAPGLVGRPYSLKDVRDHLAELTGNRRFADDFFDGYIEGRDVADYTHLLSLAGYVVRKTNPERAWLGGVQVEEQAGGLIVASGGGGRGGAPGATLVPFGTPIYDAGVEGGDVITMIDGAPATMTGWTALSARKIGDKVALTVRHRDGTTVTRTAVLKADPSIQTAPIENGGTLTDAQRALRQSWLGTKVK
jgi:predicted metalloprotease with PDZ domain